VDVATDEILGEMSMVTKNRNIREDRGTGGHQNVTNPMNKFEMAGHIFGAGNKSVAIGILRMVQPTILRVSMQQTMQTMRLRSQPKRKMKKKARRTKEFLSVGRFRQPSSRQRRRSDFLVEFRLIVQVRSMEIEATTKKKKKMEWIVLGGILRIGPFVYLTYCSFNSCFLGLFGIFVILVSLNSYRPRGFRM
jgi:hypothetical protein